MRVDRENVIKYIIKWNILVGKLGDIWVIRGDDGMMKNGR